MPSTQRNRFSLMKHAQPHRSISPSEVQQLAQHHTFSQHWRVVPSLGNDASGRKHIDESVSTHYGQMRSEMSAWDHTLSRNPKTNRGQFFLFSSLIGCVPASWMIRSCLLRRPPRGRWETHSRTAAFRRLHSHAHPLASELQHCTHATDAAVYLSPDAQFDERSL